MSEKFCPKCGKAVKESDSFCTNCGTKLTSDIIEEEATAVSVDENNNAVQDEIKAEEYFNPPAEPIAQQKKKSKKKPIIIASVAAVLVVAIIGVLIGLNVYRSAKYIDDAEKLTTFMLSSAADAEEAANLTRAVWHNSIFEERSSETDKYTRSSYGYFYDDFNTALLNLFTDKNFSSKIDKLENEQDLVEATIKDLKDPPKEHEELYDDLVAFYLAYNNLVDLATDPDGSLTTYTEEFSDADQDTIDAYNKLEMYFD